MFGCAALSNHGVSSESELRDIGVDGYYAENTNPLQYHTNISERFDIIYKGSQFTTIQQRGGSLKLSLPNKIIRFHKGDYYANANVFLDIFRKKRLWLSQQQG